MTVLYALFIVSLICPVYTYAIYPIILKLFKGREFKIENISPSVTLAIVGKKETDCESYDMEVIHSRRFGKAKERANCDIIVFTDDETKLDANAVTEIIKPFSDERIDCVVGQQTNPEGNSAFWKYENIVRSLESRIGCVSGANHSLFAVRKTAMPDVPETVKNEPFFITTSISQSGRNIVFQPGAKVYESSKGDINFEKHVQDAIGYWQAFKMFPNMLLPRNGAFVYISHRVMKWFVWLNMLFLLITSGILGLKSLLMAALFFLQFIGYAVVILWGKKNKGGILGKIIDIGYYFVRLNEAYLVGLLRCLEGKA